MSCEDERNKERKMKMSDIVSYDFTDVVASIKSNFTFHAQGSEAKLYFGSFLGERLAILKERFAKKYRHPSLDKSLSIKRMKQEVRILAKCKEIGVMCPTIYFVDMNERCIIMQYIQNSISVKDFIFDIKNANKLEPTQSLEFLGSKIGENLALLHKNDIIHGDLTTSNMLLHKDQRSCILLNKDFDLYFIDFGLSKKELLIEDKAVDLYVLERAILSSHPEAEQFYETILKGYFANVGKSSKAIANKLKEVQQRGRKRCMLG